ncbi:hypothetical protein CH341_22400 [Rhodoplanes roseus]|uniref:DUF937 domain-containing protein n=2 Tax=Rhodoplanes roseus TaxID=29409 RepID=A0A327KQF5_9BRAD|nr:YidB family protein [Rhodoplanes roseus]RAI41119.1 hypothetical protein CH341_22400 [Rhodoplanes roseus]
MGLLDVINGMMNGPRGERAPEPAGGAGDKSGMSPITMAVLGLLAYKAYKHFGSGSAPVPQAETNAPPWGPGKVGHQEGSSGGLGGLLGGLGGLLGGGAAGGALSGGLKDLVDQFHQKGKGDVADSWIGKGPNKSISARDLEETLGRDRIDELARRTGLSRDELLAELSQRLPEAVDEVTPQGRLPSETEVRRWL